MEYIKYTIVCKGKTECDTELALNEAVRLIKEGCFCGSDSNDTGGFRFDSTRDVPKDQRPR